MATRRRFLTTAAAAAAAVGVAATPIPGGAMTHESDGDRSPPPSDPDRNRSLNREFRQLVMAAAVAQSAPRPDS